MVSKRIILPIVAISAGGVMLFTASQAVYAQSTPLDGLVATIAQKFGLDKAKAQEVVDQYRSDRKSLMRQTMQKRLQSRLDQAVKDGKLTPDQEKALLDKLLSLQSSKNSQDFKNMTPQQRQAEMQKERDDLSTWAKSQSIDLSIVMPFKMGMGKHRMLMK